MVASTLSSSTPKFSSHKSACMIPQISPVLLVPLAHSKNQSECFSVVTTCPKMSAAVSKKASSPSAAAASINRITVAPRPATHHTFVFTSRLTPRQCIHTSRAGSRLSSLPFPPPYSPSYPPLASSMLALLLMSQAESPWKQLSTALALLPTVHFL